MMSLKNQNKTFLEVQSQENSYVNSILEYLSV